MLFSVEAFREPLVSRAGGMMQTCRAAVGVAQRTVSAVHFYLRGP